MCSKTQHNILKAKRLAVDFIYGKVSFEALVQKKSKIFVVK